MGFEKFLKPKKFTIKPKGLEFRSVKWMTNLEKKKIYTSFIAFLNNHFKSSLFKKSLYEHFYCHCGFIAHYNIHGFYGEYFETAACYHYNVNGFENKISEYCGNLNVSSDSSHGEQFFSIYSELQQGIMYKRTYQGLGGFYRTIMDNQNWGGYADFKDLDDAIKEAFNEYLSLWELEIEKAQKAYTAFVEKENISALKAKEIKLKEEQAKIQKDLFALNTKLDQEIEKEKEEAAPVQKQEQELTLFDFMVA